MAPYELRPTSLSTGRRGHGQGGDTRFMYGEFNPTNELQRAEKTEAAFQFKLNTFHFYLYCSYPYKICTVAHSMHTIGILQVMSLISFRSATIDFRYTSYLHLPYYILLHHNYFSGILNTMVAWVLERRVNELTLLTFIIQLYDPLQYVA